MGSPFQTIKVKHVNSGERKLAASAMALTKMT